MSAPNNLKMARLERGLTQWEVANATGIHQTYISLYENKLKDATYKHKKALAKLYARRVKDLWQ